MKIHFGLGTLLLTTMLQRTAFYMFMSVMIGYFMDKYNMRSSDSGVFYTSFYSAFYFLMVIMGVLADFTNRRIVITISLIAVAAGYLLMGITPGNMAILLVIPFIFITFGNAAFVPNILVMVGNIFKSRPNKTYLGFILYIAAVNIGAFVAPFLAEFVKGKFGYDIVFILVGVVMIGAFLVFYLLRNWYSEANDVYAKRVPPVNPNSGNSTYRVLALLAILILAIPVSFVVNHSTLTFRFFILDNIVGGHEVASQMPWLNALFSFLIAILVAVVFAFAFKFRNYSFLKMIGLGVVIASIPYFIIVIAINSATASVGSNPIYLAAFFSSLAEVLVIPFMLFGLYKTSAASLKGLFFGIYFIITAIVNQLLFVTAEIYGIYGPGFTFTFSAIILLVLSIPFFILWGLARRNQVAEN